MLGIFPVVPVFKPVGYPSTALLVPVSDKFD